MFPIGVSPLSVVTKRVVSLSVLVVPGGVPESIAYSAGEPLCLAYELLWVKTRLALLPLELFFVHPVRFPVAAL